MRSRLSVACSLLLLCSLHAGAQSLPQRINDTGLVRCYAGSGDGGISQVGCTNPAWPGQDGASGRDPAAAAGTLPKVGAGDGGFDFSKLSNGGAELPASAADGTGPNDWGCTRDNVTGLVWRIRTEAGRSWAQARAAIAAANAANACGRADWRLPTVDELLGLVDFRFSVPAIDATYFPRTSAGFHWTADRAVDTPARRRIVNFAGGFVHALDARRAADLQLVAGGEDFAPFAVGGDGTVLDPRTGLAWERCSLGQAGTACNGEPAAMNWLDALRAVQDLNAQNWRGHSDWRLPNVKELASLVQSSTSPAIDAGAFPGATPVACWSSTTYVRATRTAWSVFFGSGDVYAKDKATRACVRAVRTASAAAGGARRDALFADDFDGAGPPPLQPVDALPVVSLTTAGGVPIDRENYVAGTLTISGDGEPYQGALQVRGRGNSTWSMPKKPYRLKLDVKAPLLGMPSDRHWVLLANYADKSLLRNALAFTLGDRLGMAWNPRSRMVQLTLNGEYQGVYQLAEHVRVGANRVDITEMEPGDIAPPEVTGGYLFELDMRRDCAPIVQFDTSRGVAFCIDTPDEDDIVPAQYEWLRGYVQQTEDAIWSPGFADPATGYRAWLDPRSFIDWYLVSELTANVDSVGYSSIWHYKDRDGLLQRGPLWDHDLSTGNAYYAACADPRGFWVHEGTWYQRLFADPWFAAEVRARWDAVRAEAIDGLPALLDDAAPALVAAAADNFETWPIAETWVWPNVVVTGSWEGELEYVKDWLRQRTDWLDRNL